MLVRGLQGFEDLPDDRILRGGRRGGQEPSGAAWSQWRESGTMSLAHGSHENSPSVPRHPIVSLWVTVHVPAPLDAPQSAYSFGEDCAVSF